MNKRFVSAAFATVFAGFLPSLAFALPSGAAFLEVDPSPRSYALGNGNPAAAMGAQALYSNPAALSRTDRRFEFFSAYSSIIEGVQYGYGGFAINRAVLKKTRVTGLGFSFTNLRVGSMEARDFSGYKSGGDFGAQNTSYGLSFSYGIADSLNFGFTGKLIQSEIGGFASNRAFGSDFGLRYQPKKFNRPMELGITLANFGQGLQFINRSDPLPTSLNIGLSVGLGPVTGLVGVSRLVNEGTTGVSAGFEFGLNVVSLRTGYRSDSGSSGARGGTGAGRILENFTTGMGLRLGSFKLDYAISKPSEQSDAMHRVGLTFQWGKSAMSGEPNQ